MYANMAWASTYFTKLKENSLSAKTCGENYL